MNFSYFTSNKAQTANATLTVSELVARIESGANGLSEIINQARAVYDPQNKAEYDAIKNKLPAFVPHRFDGTGRTLKNITDYSGIVVLDLDGLTANEAGRVRDTVFAESENCLLAFLSPSGRGVKALIVTDARDKAQAHDTYQAVTDYFAPLVSQCLGHEMRFDESGKDAPRLCYLSFDPQLHCNGNAVPLPIRYPDTASKPTKTKRTIHTETACEYTVIQRKAEQYLKDKGFSPHEGSGRHGILTQLAGYLNAGGVNLIVAENIFRNALATYGLSSEYIENKISTVLHSIYSQYAEQFGTRPLSEYGNKERAIVSINRYVTERADVIADTLTAGNKRTLVIAPTGTGKSTAYLQTARELDLGENDYIIYYTPNRDTAINLYETNDADALAIGGRNWKADLQQVKHRKARLIIAVIDNHNEIVHYIKTRGGRVYTIIADELHKVESDVTFRNSAITPLSRVFSNRDYHFIGITATPSPYMEREGLFDQIIEFKPIARQTVNAYVERWYDLDHIANKVLESLKKGRKVCIRVSSKTEGKYLQTFFQRHGKEAPFVHRDTKERDFHLQLAEKGRFESDILICTKILEDGFSFVDDTPIDFFFLYGQSETLNPIPARQFSARARKQSKTDCYIYYTPRKNYGDKLKDYLKGQLYFATHIQNELNGFTFDEQSESFAARTVCTSGRKRINKDKSIHFFSVLNESTRKYFTARANDFEKELLSYFDVLTDLDEYQFDEKRVKAIKESKNKIQMKKKEETQNLLATCKDESFFNYLAGGYGKDMKLVTVPPTDPYVCRNICKEWGWTIERVTETDYKNILQRVDTFKREGIDHERAVMLVAENWNNLRYHEKTVQLDEYKRLARVKEGKGYNNAVTEYDKGKELELVGIIEKFGGDGKDFRLESLVQYIKDTGFPMYHLCGDDTDPRTKIALILRIYFDYDHKHAEDGNYWKIRQRHDYDSLRECLFGNTEGDGNAISAITASSANDNSPVKTTVSVPLPPETPRFSFRDGLLDRYFLN